jgi:SAM-dependent methyltransferase
MKIFPQQVIAHTRGLRVKVFLRSLSSVLPLRLINRLDAFKHRRHWLKQDARCHAMYMEQYQSRTEVISLAQQWLLTKGTSIERVNILEFGCSAANNLKLLQELIEQPLHYVGFDLQPKAIDMAKGQFSDAQFFVGDEVVMMAQMPTLARFHIFLASGILAYLPPARCHEVLSMAARYCDAVLICDDLTCFHDEQGSNDGLFLHPYSRLCCEAGLRLMIGPTPPTLGSRYSCFLAVSD